MGASFDVHSGVDQSTCKPELRNSGFNKYIIDRFVKKYSFTLPDRSVKGIWWMPRFYMAMKDVVR